MKTPIEVFSDWVDIGKDEGMEKNHYMPVMEMIKLYNTSNAYSFIDAGCGNGWLVRYLFENTKCINGIGIDGSNKMIKKARSLDNLGTYFNSDLMSWNPENKVNVVFSMEVLYYFENPQELIKKIHDNWLLKNGRLIMGIDYYFENTTCHDWKEKTKVNIMKLHSIEEWLCFFESSGFKNINYKQVCTGKNWEGTLVVYGDKD